MEYIFTYKENSEEKVSYITGDDVTFIIKKETLLDFRIVFSEFTTDYNGVIGGSLSSLYELLKIEGITDLVIQLREEPQSDPYIIFTTAAPIVGIEVRPINGVGDNSENRKPEDNLKVEMFIG